MLPVSSVPTPERQNVDEKIVLIAAAKFIQSGGSETHVGEDVVIRDQINEPTVDPLRTPSERLQQQRAEAAGPRRFSSGETRVFLLQRGTLSLQAYLVRV